MTKTNFTTSNSSYNTVKPELDFTGYFTNGYMALKILIETVCILGILLNALLLIVTYQVKSKRRNYFCLVKRLAWADLLLSLSQAVYPITFAFHVRDNRRGLAFYTSRSIELGFKFSFKCAVAVNLIMIALDSYIAIIHPLRYTTVVTSRKINAMLIFVWLFPLLCGFSCFFTAAIQKIFYFPSTDYFRLAVFCRDNTGTFYIQYSVVSIVQLTCVLVLIVIYTRICVEICKQQRFERDQAGIRSEDYKQQRKGMVTSFFVIATYFALSVPYELFIAVIGDKNINYDRLNGMLALLTFLNTICDPIIYAFRLTEVRNSIRRMYNLS